MAPCHEPPIQAGRDAFYCVPEFSGEDEDAVERVPTGFMAAEHVGKDEGPCREPAPSNLPKFVAYATKFRNERFMVGEHVRENEGPSHEPARGLQSAGPSDRPTRPEFSRAPDVPTVLRTEARVPPLV